MKVLIYCCIETSLFKKASRQQCPEQLQEVTTTARGRRNTVTDRVDDQSAIQNRTCRSCRTLVQLVQNLF
jgi:hypothetical protein